MRPTSEVNEPRQAGEHLHIYLLSLLLFSLTQPLSVHGYAVRNSNKLLGLRIGDEPFARPEKDSQQDLAAALLSRGRDDRLAAQLLSDGSLLSSPPPNQALNSDGEIYMLEDKDYPKSLFEHYPGVGQVTGIATLPSGDVAIVHRADRIWDENTFSANYSLADLSRAQDNLIKNDTIMIIERDDGSAVTTLGANLFYLPHSVASDNQGNLWVTDVGRHQVMRLPTSMMQLDHVGPDGQPTKRWLPGNLTRIWPDIILGEAFVPGTDAAHFCQPSEVEVSSDGSLVYVADGYCNKRIMVFTGAGRFLLSFGQQLDMDVVHSLTLIEERNLLCAADRENGRILCFRAGLDGDWSTIGELVLTVKYPLGRVFAIEGLGPNHMLVSSNQRGTNRYDLATLNPFTKELKQTWTSSDLLVPHSLARTKDGLYVYAADMHKDAARKIFKFNVIRRKF